ncbi:hypothetical protein [Sulfitobacter sp. SK011]|uniref:hypothetical protein n=1 Tax=Sulfitobacter sp. SK011 TaxID=1389004 RepID=UPI000E0B32C5|nr:hypothetical protein [Sulfitobacter sp. SK011]AXI42683.1 hypothetical protein C1J02_12555 [Sulfitobacter sp. SK011]
MRKFALGLLYVAVALLVSVPPIFAALLSGMCMNPTGAACRTVTMSDWFKGELAMIWMPPLVLAIVLIWVIFRLHRAAPQD